MAIARPMPGGPLVAAARQSWETAATCQSTRDGRIFSFEELHWHVHGVVGVMVINRPWCFNISTGDCRMTYHGGP